MSNRYADLAARLARHVTTPGITPSPVEQVNLISYTGP